MTTETTEPLEQAVMEAATDFAADVLFVGVVVDKRTDAPRAKHRHTRERLRLHVQLFGLKKLRDGVLLACRGVATVTTEVEALVAVEDEIAALEVRLQEGSA